MSDSAPFPRGRVVVYVTLHLTCCGICFYGICVYCEPGLFVLSSAAMSTAIRLSLTSLLTCCLAFVCHADVVYTFSYTATSGPVQDFSFSFTSPSFVTVGSSPAFTPFTLTDGVNNWTMTQDKVDLADPTGLNIGCFMFGTPSAELDLGGPPPFGPCSFIPHEGAFRFDINGGLPSALGIYPARDFIGGFDTPAGLESIGGPLSLVGLDTGTMSLDITNASIPEPTSLSLILIAVLVISAVPAARRRAFGPFGLL